ncbi:hypothetical protein D9M69_735030 [compost metagenome]
MLNRRLLLGHNIQIRRRIDLGQPMGDGIAEYLVEPGAALFGHIERAALLHATYST